jgi:hypothetical protein
VRGLRRRDGRISAILATVLSAALAACAHEAERPATPAKQSTKQSTEAAPGQGQILIGDGAYAGGADVLAAWTVYGVDKAAAFDAHPPPPANESADDFEIDLQARRDLCEFWGGADAKRQPYPLLDRQVEIWRAGYLPELVVAVHSKPGWTIPAHAIEAFRFEEFVQKFPGAYNPDTPVAVRPPSGKPVPAVPGADFPDPEQLPYGPASCDLLVSERRAAWVRWGHLEPRLGGAPVAADSTLDFVRALAAMKRDPARIARGATWVSIRVGHLAALEAFCAIEKKQWAFAVTSLEAAASMMPGNPHVRLELSMAVMHLGKLREALAIADDVRSWSDDGCAVAVAWRRRGYILIELGDLVGARTAYERSRKLDPESAVAREELASIAEALASGRVSVKPLPPAAPDGVRLTKCQH